MDDFLLDLEGRDWVLPAGIGDSAVSPDMLYLQDAQLGLQVAVADASSKPKADDIRKVWRKREDGKGFPLMLVVRYPKAGVTTCAVCGPSGADPKLVFDADPATVARICNAALKKPNRAAALAFLATAEVEEQSGLPGLRNVGLFATHELTDGVPARDDWNEACENGRPVLGEHGRGLVAALGFEVADRGIDTSVLVATGEDRAVAVFLEEAEAFDQPAGRFHGTSPVAHALAAADREGLAWVMLVRGSTVRLYPAKPDVGVGRRGRAGTYVEANLDLLPFEQAGYLTLLFSAEALAGDSVAEILESSSIYVAGLGGRLRDRVYFDAVPSLATAIAGTFDDTSAEGLRAAYQRTMTVLFRLLFVAYGEDKELLPYRTNGAYADNSLTAMAKTLTEQQRGEQSFDPRATDLWEQVTELWSAIEHGRSDWDVPPYGGTLFSTDPQVNPDGAALAGIELSNAEFGPTLMALLVDTGPDGLLGPVDFRSLSVREFGTIYEGLLESELSVARSDLAEAKGNLVPAGEGDEVVVAEGEIYFHNQSGVRKSTGSYFTKPFAVEHLLRHALAPALDDHLDRVRELLVSGDEAGAARTLFDFRVADIAMGSGHFLVAAIDHLEARFSRFLADHPIAVVNADLDALCRAAERVLGDLADRYRIETTQVLRRLIARRCIYGVDLNPISVELARLGVWIHTFVPGLPLSFLDHNLVVGNSLTGIGTLDEVTEYMEGDKVANSFSRSLVEAQIAGAAPFIDRLVALSDATLDDVEAARDAESTARESLRPAIKVLDLLVLARAGLALIDPMLLNDPAAVERGHAATRAQENLTALDPLHFPLAFPEVFAGDRQGFDCILGNPPWDEVMVDEDSFWACREPGIQSLPAKAMTERISELRAERADWQVQFEDEVELKDLTRQVLTAGPFPEFNVGNADLYKAFCWRFWHLCAPRGVLGVVLPRSALSARGTSAWRHEVLGSGDFIEVTTGTNTAGWVFDEAHFQYTIAFVSIQKTGTPDDVVAIRGPFPSLAAYKTGLQRPALELAASNILDWSSSASFPLVPSASAGNVFLRMRKSPDIADPDDTWATDILQGDFNATTGRKKGFFSVDLEAEPPGAWPVWGGSGFDLWELRPGKAKGWADPDVAGVELQRRRIDGYRRSNSVWSGMDPAWIRDEATLPCRNPRLAFRDVTNRTNSRTIIAALIPPDIVLNNKAPYLLWPSGDQRDEAYLLGVLCSVPLDWYARCVVELSVNFFIFNALPVPRPGRENPLRHRVEQIAGRLAAVDERYAEWAAEVGVPVGSVTSQTEKDDLIAELDAVVAHLYGLDRGDLEVIWDTFYDKTPRNDRRPPLERALEHHERWAEHA